MICFISKRRLLTEIDHLNPSFSPGVIGMRKASFASSNWPGGPWPTPTEKYYLCFSLPDPVSASWLSGFQQVHLLNPEPTRSTHSHFFY